MLCVCVVCYVLCVVCVCVRCVCCAPLTADEVLTLDLAETTTLKDRVVERGQRVKVVGLERAVHLNGLVGEVVDLNEAGRVVVSLEDPPPTDACKDSAGVDERRCVCVLPEHLEASVCVCVCVCVCCVRVRARAHVRVRARAHVRVCLLHNERGLNERGLNEPELNERELNERELNERELNEPELNERGLNERELNERELNERELNEPELRVPCTCRLPHLFSFVVTFPARSGRSPTSPSPTSTTHNLLHGVCNGWRNGWSAGPR